VVIAISSLWTHQIEHLLDDCWVEMKMGGLRELIMQSAHQEFDQLIHSLSILPDEIIADVIRTFI